MQRKKNRKRQQEKRTQINKKKKIEEVKKIRKNVHTDSRGKVKNTKPKLISNIGKNADFGQRAAKLKQSMGGIGSMTDYKKTEKKAFKKAEKYQKKKKKEEDKKNKLKIKKNKTTGGGTTRTKSSTPTGYVRYKGKLVSTRTAQGKHAMNKLKAKKRAQEMAKKRLGK